MLFPPLLIFCVMLLISPYIVINRMAAWADHTAVLEEAIPQQDKFCLLYTSDAADE